MSKPTSTKSWIRKGLKIALLIEIAYIVIFNAILQIPQTQTLINQIRPEKFHVRWESAWTLYPFRINLSGASANGNSRSQTWQVDVESAAGSISLLPLFFKRAWLSDIRATGIDYRKRPRLKPEKDYSQVEAFFPIIEGREVSNADITPRKKKRPWLISLENIRIDGGHSYWLNQFKGDISGVIRANLDYRSRGGPLQLDIFELKLDLQEQLINGDREMISGGNLAGSMGFVPFKPRENKGVNLLKFLKLDINMNIDVNNLKFINLFLLDFDQFTVDGNGEVNGQIRLDQGELLTGTDLNVAARNMQVKVMDHTIGGGGSVSLKMGEEKSDRLALGFDFSDLDVVHGNDPRAVLKGRSFVLSVGGDGKLLPDPDNVNENWTLGLTLDDMTVPDISVFNTYLSPDLPLQFTGGEASLGADLLFKPFDARGSLSLESRDINALVGRQSVRADVIASIQLGGGRPVDRLLDVSGSSITLDRVRVKGEKQDYDDEAWSAIITLNKADAVLAKPLQLDIEAELKASDSRPFVAMFRNRDGWQPKFLANAMTLEDIVGNALLEVAENRLIIPEAYVTSDNAEAGMKAVFSGQGEDGVAYFKYKKLDAILMLKNGDRNIDILKARQKYDGYSIVD
jgi:hypothetical protein